MGGWVEGDMPVTICFVWLAGICPWPAFQSVPFIPAYLPWMNCTQLPHLADLPRAACDMCFALCMQHMLGMTAGESRTFTVVFPEDHEVLLWQGMSVLATVKLHELLYWVLPEVSVHYAGREWL